MKLSPARLLLPVVLCVVLLVLAWNVVSQQARTDLRASRATDLPRGVEPTAAEPAVGLDADHVVLAPDGRLDSSRAETPVVPVENSHGSWLPPFEELDVLDRTAGYVLESYWGAKWPEVEGLLRKARGDDLYELALAQFQVPSEHRALLEPYGFEKLQGRDAFMRKLRDWFIADFDQRPAPTYPYALAVMGVAGVSFAPTEGYDAQRIIGAALRTAEQRGVESRHLASPVAVFHFQSELFQRHGRVVADLLTELEFAASALHADLRAALDRDLREIDEDTLPSVGLLFVGPVMGISLHHAQGLDRVAQRYVFSLAAGHHLDMGVDARARLVNHWGAQYSADMRDFRTLQSALAHADATQARVSAAIYEIVLAELEREG